MKKLTTISLFIFWAVVTAILIAGLLSYENKQAEVSTPTTPDVNANQTTGIAGDTALSLAEVAKHNILSDCWQIINNKVYNLSSFLSAHPGGVSSMSPYCGKEATQAYATKDIGKPHSANAQAMLASYYLGDFNQSVAAPAVQEKVQQTNAVTPPAGDDDGEEDEQEFEDD